ncbi:MAG: serine/threonine-protein phosphatase [Chloroflexi bacterium]|nr:serine/threonine-protein phosphatase [Chloroflexota bacterium]
MELTLDYNLLLNKGLVRERNEDRCAAFEPDDPPVREERGRLFVLADGVGGHAAGDVAADTAVTTIKDSYFRGPWQGATAQLHEALVTANRVIREKARSSARQGMGAAAVAAAVVQKQIAVAHLGDCRGYLIRLGRVTQLTSDHSWVQERLNAGRLTANEARAHPYRNVLTRALGADPQAEPDVSQTPLHLGDVVVLCSDGLWGLTEDHELSQTVVATANAEEAVTALVNLALSRGGHDNISVIVIRVIGPQTEAKTAVLRRGSRE